ncbi:outer membrane protein assembly factor BamA [bacterium]|nr:outer membrane protein assembly factor BamA [bacterium]
MIAAVIDCFALGRKCRGILLLSFFIFSIQHAWSQAISKVEVLGNNRIEADAILEKMSLRKGVTPTQAAVKQDILDIFSLGYFEDIRIEQEASKLIVRVKERPVISTITYKGAEEFQDDDLKEITGLKPFMVLSLSQLAKAQKDIAKKYEEKGYYLARAEYKLEPASDRPNEVDVVFQVTEDERVKVRRVFFLGNEVFTSADLKQNMITSEGHVFSWMTGGGSYREDLFERDLGLLAFFYGNEGYIQARFSKPRVTLSQDRRYVDVFIDVDEGEQHFLGEVTFEGEGLIFTDEELRESFEMADGDVFSTGKLQQQILALTDKYGDEGYAFANVIPRTTVRNGTKIVDLRIDIEKGEKIYWGKIKISGNSKTHDKVIRRELKFAEGELTHATKRKKSFEKIRALGFFGQDINFLTSSPAGEPTVLDLEIRVEEKPTGSLNVSAGYGTATNFVFGANVGQNNLFGLGQQLQFSLNWSSRNSKSFNLGWADPKIFDSDYYFGTNFFYNQSRVGPPTDNEYSYLQQSWGSSLRLGRDIGESTKLYGRYRWSRTMLRDPFNSDIFTSPDDADSVISALSTEIEYDTRNNRLDPTSGWYMSAFAEYAGLGGRTFQRTGFSVRRYTNVAWKLVYRTNLEYSYLFNTVNDETVPDSERFILGGIQDLRGYDYGTIGPNKLLNNTRDENKSDITRLIPFGGTQKVVFNHELEFPLIPEANIRAVMFLDIGQAWDDQNPDHNIANLSPAFLSNYGWGLRWYSPMGPLRFEWGYPLTESPYCRRPESSCGKDAVFQFIIAPTF